MKFFSSALLLLLLFLTFAVQAEKLKVTVSIPPQAFLAERIAGKAAVVNIMVPDGRSPHDYAPPPLQVKNAASSSVYFLIGRLPFENEIAKKLQGQSAVLLCDTSAGIKLLRAAPCEHDHHGEGDHQHNHGESGDDPHVWMNPENLRAMAANMLPVLQRLLPDNREMFQKNFQELVGELSALDKKIAAELAPYKGRAVYVYHPAFGYFCDRYGLKQEAIEEGGKDPTPKQIMELIADAKRDKVKIIIVQKQFNSRSAAKIGEAIGGRVVPIDNLEYNVIRMLDHLAGQITDGLNGK